MPHLSSDVQPCPTQLSNLCPTNTQTPLIIPQVEQYGGTEGFPRPVPSPQERNNPKMAIQHQHHTELLGSREEMLWGDEELRCSNTSILLTIIQYQQEKIPALSINILKVLNKSIKYTKVYLKYNYHVCEEGFLHFLSLQSLNPGTISSERWSQGSAAEPVCTPQTTRRPGTAQPRQQLCSWGPGPK